MIHVIRGALCQPLQLKLSQPTDWRAMSVRRPFTLEHAGNFDGTGIYVVRLVVRTRKAALNNPCRWSVERWWNELMSPIPEGTGVFRIGKVDGTMPALWPLRRGHALAFPTGVASPDFQSRSARVCKPSSGELTGASTKQSAHQSPNNLRAKTSPVPDGRLTQYGDLPACHPSRSLTTPRYTDVRSSLRSPFPRSPPPL